MMGACLEPTPQMGPYTVEVRGESFYLGCPRDRLDVTPDRAWSIPTGDVPALAAAFDQVRAHPYYAVDLHARTHHDAEPQEDGDVPAHRADAPAHKVELREQRINIEGLGYAYLGDESTKDWPYQTVEVLYRHLPTLQEAITTAAEAAPPTGTRR